MLSQELLINNKISVSIVLTSPQIFDYGSYGKNIRMGCNDNIYSRSCVIYLGIEALIRPTERMLKDNCENK